MNMNININKNITNLVAAIFEQARLDYASGDEWLRADVKHFAKSEWFTMLAPEGVTAECFINSLQ